MSSALEDVIVLDLTRDFSSCLAAAFLADFGGRVIRVELLNANDPVDETVTLPDCQERLDVQAGTIHVGRKQRGIDLLA
ncbi:MAG: CoA transferase, partial [Deltaproteobacteria bacterium]|nr:CoA transferase [Deltaproteobacteria bacterium]